MENFEFSGADLIKITVSLGISTIISMIIKLFKQLFIIPFLFFCSFGFGIISIIYKFDLFLIIEFSLFSMISILLFNKNTNTWGFLLKDENIKTIQKIYIRLREFSWIIFLFSNIFYLFFMASMVNINILGFFIFIVLFLGIKELVYGSKGYAVCLNLNSTKLRQVNPGSNRKYNKAILKLRIMMRGCLNNLVITFKTPRGAYLKFDDSFTHFHSLPVIFLPTDSSSIHIIKISKKIIEDTIELPFELRPSTSSKKIKFKINLYINNTLYNSIQVN